MAKKTTLLQRIKKNIQTELKLKNTAQDAKSTLCIRRKSKDYILLFLFMIDIFATNYGCNTYIVFNGAKDGFIVDPGYNGNNALLKHIEKLGINIKGILLTHAHYDHIGGLNDVLEAFKDIKVFISEDEIPVLNDIELNGLYEPLNVPEDRIAALGDGESIKLAGYTIKTIKTPFHTCGSICFLLEEENALFTGDTLFKSSIGRTDLPTGSYRQIEPSLRKLINLDPNLKVYPGHDAITTLERELKYNQYLRNIIN